MVEFGLTAPLFIMLVWGIIEAGLALWTQFGLQNGVEAAARCASINTTTCSDSTTTAQYAVNNALGITVPSSTFRVQAGTCGNLVKANYTYSFFTLFFGTPTVTLTAQSCYPASSGVHLGG